jgi:hypothetical protein
LHAISEALWRCSRAGLLSYDYWQQDSPWSDQEYWQTESHLFLPYARFDHDRQIFEARQYAKSSGYPVEDAEIGIAATALSFGLLANEMIEERRSAGRKTSLNHATSNGN